MAVIIKEFSNMEKSNYNQYVKEMRRFAKKRLIQFQDEVAISLGMLFAYIAQKRKDTKSRWVWDQYVESPLVENFYSKYKNALDNAAMDIADELKRQYIAIGENTYGESKGILDKILPPAILFAAAFPLRDYFESQYYRPFVDGKGIKDRIGIIPIESLLMLRNNIPGAISRSLVLSKTERDYLMPVFNSVTSKFDVIVHDTMIRGQNDASELIYGQNPNVVKGLIRVAVFDDRTCLVCVLMDGIWYPVGSFLDDHANGRCYFVPDIISLDEYNKRYRESSRINSKYRNPAEYIKITIPGNGTIYKLHETGYATYPDAIKSFKQRSPLEQSNFFNNKSNYILWKQRGGSINDLYGFIEKKNGIWNLSSNKVITATFKQWDASRKKVLISKEKYISRDNEFVKA